MAPAGPVVRAVLLAGWGVPKVSEALAAMEAEAERAGSAVVGSTIPPISV